MTFRERMSKADRMVAVGVLFWFAPIAVPLIAAVPIVLTWHRWGSIEWAIFLLCIELSLACVCPIIGIRYIDRSRGHV